MIMSDGSELGVQDFAPGFLNLVLYFYLFGAFQLSHFICNYWRI